ncbi:hypothetical protein A11Q_1994 [Pseudobdellovibrio exovorus JSS]|uniref:Uncharacterized protein n=2 Tax=Pseudobdellovibrio exovorus TaxID=453816 RepID=M4VCK1_9BACT|nr:hypothetical protein A11Q_1994 [Pseudobdellovibrio exovorus JSS]
MESVEKINLNEELLLFFRFFAPQIEHAFWAWATALLFVATAVIIASSVKNNFFSWSVVLYGLFLFADELGQAHECFAENTGLSPLYYIYIQASVALVLSYFWFREYPFKRQDFLYIGSVGFLIVVALFLRSNLYPNPTRVIEELAEFSVAAICCLYVIRRSCVGLKKSTLIVSLIGIILIISVGPLLRRDLCPRVEYWVQKSPYSIKGF